MGGRRRLRRGSERRWHAPCSACPSGEEGAMEAAGLLVSDEFARWFEWLAAADPEAAGELRAGLDAYAGDLELQQEPVALDVCLSPPPRGMAFVAAHLGLEGIVLVASGAEIGESPRRCTTLVRRAEKVVRRHRRGSVQLFPWEDVRRWLPDGAEGVSAGE